MTMLTTRSVAIAVVVAATTLVWLGRPGVPRANPPTDGRNIIAFGDSLVEGRGATPGHDFVSLLSRRLQAPIINAGRSGDTTATALARLNSDVLSRSPRIVVVLLGGNDFLRGVPAETTFRNLSTIVERIRARGAAVVLVGVSVGILSDPYSERYEDVARQYGAGLVADILDGVLGRSDRMADTIHPNDAGHAIMADRLEHVLFDLLRTK